MEAPDPSEPVVGAEAWSRPVGLGPGGEGPEGDRLPAGRNAALVALFAAYYRRLVGLASLLVDDQTGAEDVVQDAFLAISGRWGKLRDPDAAYGDVHPWVVTGGLRLPTP